MIFTILGSGTSTGVPLIGCRCAVCRSKDPKNQRLRASVWVQAESQSGVRSILIDTSPDFRAQALRAKIPRIDAVLYTHPHSDHLHGIDDLRAYNFLQHADIPVFGNAWTIDDLKTRFAYIFAPGPVEGGGIPRLTPQLFTSDVAELQVAGIKVVPISLQHGSRECIAYRFDSVAYVTDCSYIPETSLARLQGLEVLVLDCVRLEHHRTHLNLDEALDWIAKIKPRKTYLTHLGHDFDYGARARLKLPRGVALAYDGLRISSA